ncbi:MAG: hypothetical protein NTW32_07680 [Chloroflexi bacterium]|nr:hypothetical protein [Chloroflexota bacterium]
MLFLRRDAPVNQADILQYNIWFYTKLQWEFNFYLGLIGVFFLLFFGLFLWLKKPDPIYKQLIAPFFILVACSIGSTYWLLKLSNIPLLGSERVSARMISLPVVLLMIIGTINFQNWLNQKRPGEWQLLTYISMLILFAIDLYNNLRVWRISESASFFGSTPLNPAGSLIANHTDPAYILFITIGLILTIFTSVLLTLLVIREKNASSV